MPRRFFEVKCMKTISIDIETFSDINLAKCGVYNYAESPAFEILLFGYSVDGGEVQVTDLVQGESIPDEILDALTDDMRYPRKAAITFDDGLEDTFTVAYPILRRRQIPFTVFVLSHMVGQPGYLSAEQLKKMQRDPLVTIGVHGSKHRILTECTPEEQAEEIFASKQVLEKLLGQTCDLFAYSHGQYDDNIRKLISFLDIIQYLGIQ